MVSAKHSRPEFDRSVEEYLPSIIFKDMDAYDIAFHTLALESIPKTLLTPGFSKKDFIFFLRKFGFENLDAAINQDDFKEFIFDTDIRRKIDAMSLSSVFRNADIYREFSTINPLYIDIYLKIFSNFTLVVNKYEYVNRYFGDKEERKLMNLIVKNTSKDYLRAVLDIQTKEVVPKKSIEHALNIVSLKLKSAVLSEDDAAIEKWSKLSVIYSEKLHKFGAGSRNDVQELLDALKQDASYIDPKQYSASELDEEFKTPLPT